MTPAAAVSGIYLANPSARYFSVGRLARDQVADYAAPQRHDRRGGGAVAHAEPRLRDAPAGRSAQPLSDLEHAFGSSSPFSLGIEEEFQLLSDESYELVPRFDEVADAAQDERVRQELMTSVLEAATGVHERVADAVDEVRDIRARLRAAAAQHGR